MKPVLFFGTSKENREAIKLLQDANVSFEPIGSCNSDVPVLRHNYREFRGLGEIGKFISSIRA